MHPLITSHLPLPSSSCLPSSSSLPMQLSDDIGNDTDLDTGTSTLIPTTAITADTAALIETINTNTPLFINSLIKSKANVTIHQCLLYIQYKLYELQASALSSWIQQAESELDLQLLPSTVHENITLLKIHMRSTQEKLAVLKSHMINDIYDLDDILIDLLYAKANASGNASVQLSEYVVADPTDTLAHLYTAAGCNHQEIDENDSYKMEDSNDFTNKDTKVVINEDKVIVNNAMSSLKNQHIYDILFLKYRYKLNLKHKHNVS